ncbi:MAG: SUF system NifU family Fe-S cluster assembly protein [Mycoplasmoidaceae bacterium]|nr:SUF system NifU family Fe-S cluster assembly protein [Mycoplasmoidaceae bacterium]
MKINNELAKEIIIDHYESPANKVNAKPKGKYLFGHNDSPSCIDNIDGYVLIQNGIVKDAKFSGIGCAICTSSTDLLVEEILNKPVEKAKKIIKNYLQMILGAKYDEKLLGKLIIFKNVNKQANRIKCAMTGVQAIQKAISSHEKK